MNKTTWIVSCIFIVQLLVIVMICIQYHREPISINSRDASAPGYPISQYEQPVLPADNVLSVMNSKELADIYHRYLTKIQAYCNNIVRIGKETEGGWNICADATYTPRQSCLVFSFGIGFDFSFDDDMADRYGCQVHAFDPSMNLNDHMHSKMVSFHATGLSNTNNDVKVAGDIWRMRTFSALQEQLKHSKDTIDVLKMDIEGWEWNVIPEILANSSYQNVRQMAVEFHAFNNADTIKGSITQPINYLPRLKIICQLYEHGFRIFFTHKNTHCAIRDERGKVTDRTDSYEVSFIQSGITG